MCCGCGTSDPLLKAEGRQVFRDLRETGETCSKHRVARLMREDNLRARAAIPSDEGARVIAWKAPLPRTLTEAVVPISIRRGSIAGHAYAFVDQLACA